MTFYGCLDCDGELVEIDAVELGDPAEPEPDTDTVLLCRDCGMDMPLHEPQGDDPRPLHLDPADMP